LAKEQTVLLEQSIIYVLDDDARVRESLTALLSSMGRKVIAFASATEYLRFSRPDLPGCLVLDLEMPEMTGLELQRQLADQEGPPIVFLTGRGDIPSTVRAMKAGAVEFLSKPYDEEELVQAIDAAIAADGQARVIYAELRELRKRYASLTPRERDVLPFVVSGLLNKQTAGELGTSEITIRIHRGQIMRKMAADSLADLVRMAAKLGIP
jgi:FixJ family two-component response regulator